MTRLHDAQWRAERDLIVSRPDEPSLGTFIAAGTVIPLELRGAVAAMAPAPAKRGR